MLPDLEVADFAVAEHKHVFAAMRNLEAAGLPIDLVTIGGEADKWAKQRNVDPLLLDETLATCALRCPAPENVPHYAGIVRNHRRTRDAVTELGALLGAAERGSLAGDELVSEAAGAFMRLGEQRKVEDPGETVGQIVATECNRIALEHGQTGGTGIPTGLTKLDELTGGIPLGVPSMILARPGMGKTTLMHNMAWCAAALTDEDPLFYSYEDNHQSFAQRSISQSSGVPTERIRTRSFQQSDMAALASARKRMLARKEVIIRAAGMDVEELIRDARTRRMRGSVNGRKVGRYVFVDFVQKIPNLRGMSRNASRNDCIGANSRRLAEWASKDDIALVVGVQIGRGVESREDHVPRMEDARDCGELEQDGKLMLGLYRPNKYDQPPTGETGNMAPASLLEIHVIKNHNGQADRHASVFWDLPTHTIVNSAFDLNARRAMGGTDANGN